jgi:hypothetical protein
MGRVEGSVMVLKDQVRIAVAALAVMGIASPFPDAGAADLSLTYQAIVHTTEVHAISVEGLPGRQIGVANFRGLAIFADGRVASHRYGGHFEFEDGDGSFAGYAFWAFDDGSTLEASYVGEAVATADGGITFTGSHDVRAGTGAYEGAAGGGSFAGRRVDHLDDGGDTYWQGSLDLTVP